MKRFVAGWSRKHAALVLFVSVLAVGSGAVWYGRYRPGRAHETRREIVCNIPIPKVYRPPVDITDEEIRIAKSGEQAFGRTIELEPPSEWYLTNATGRLGVQVSITNTQGPGLGLPGTWVPCGGGTLGLPPEMCFLEATRDGVPVPCDRRPPGASGYGGLGNRSTGYPLTLQDYGDFSQPGHYTVRLIVKCPCSSGVRPYEWKTALLASNVVEFTVPERPGALQTAPALP